MTTANDGLGDQGLLSATLEAGIEQLSALQTVCFTKYTKLVVSQDGYVFWCASSETRVVKGSLHVATDQVQEEDQTIGTNQVILSTEQPVEQFNAIAPTTIWIGDWPVGDGLTIKVAFNRSDRFYRQADLFHYSGFAVYPALLAQLLTSADQIPAGPIVSNSLPIWLSYDTFSGGLTPTTVPVYPSFLVSENLAPPYVVVHIEPSRTEGLAAMPLVGPWPGTVVPGSGTADPLEMLPVSQLARDEVDLTLYGFTNAMAWQYLVMLQEASISDETFGFANIPMIQDEKRTQTEIAALAMKKRIHISANYYQNTADAIARRLILKALVTDVRVANAAYALGGFGATGVVAVRSSFGATGVVS